MAKTDAELLTEYKNRNNITGTYQDNSISGYIADVKAYMKGAGVANSIISDSASVGCIMRGVSDLMFGNGKFSDIFLTRMMQLSALPEIPPNETEGG